MFADIACNGNIRKAFFLGGKHQFCRHGFGFNAVFHLNNVHYFLQEPFVDFGNIVYFVNRYAAAECFGNNKQTLVINQMNTLAHFFIAQCFQFRHFKVNKADFQRAYSF